MVQIVNKLGSQFLRTNTDTIVKIDRVNHWDLNRSIKQYYSQYLRQETTQKYFNKTFYYFVKLSVLWQDHHQYNFTRTKLTILYSASVLNWNPLDQLFPVSSLWRSRSNIHPAPLTALSLTRPPLPPSFLSFKVVLGLCFSIYRASSMFNGSCFPSWARILVVYCWETPWCPSTSCLCRGLEFALDLCPLRWPCIL